MTVSILVPVYGVEQYIEECAVSLFSQTYPDIKYIFCDDCSPDKSIEILYGVIERFPLRKKDILIIRNNRNLGLGGTRAELFKHLHTECFMCVDSDDTLPLDAVEKLAAIMIRCKSDVVSGAYRIYSAGQLTKTIRPNHCSDIIFKKLVFTRNSNETHVWGKLYKSSILEKTGPVSFQGINMAEDMCASTIICSVTHRETIDDVVYYYRCEGGSTFSKQNKNTKFLSYLKANRKILDYFQMRGPIGIPMEIGMLHCYRFGHRHGFDKQLIDEKLDFVPMHTMTRSIYYLLRSDNNLLYNIGKLLFIVYRKAVIYL